MLEQINLSKKMEKNVYQEKMEVLEPRLAKLQRECKSLGIPVIIAFEGLGASGKGLQISKLIYPLDPRGFQVFAIKKATEEEEMHPFLWRFWTKTPEKGRIAIFDTSWYRKVSVDRFEDKISRDELTYAYQEINTFERTLTDDGAVLIKFFLYISQKEQKKRFDKLLDSKETAWRVSKEDLKRNKEYNRYKAMNEEMLEKTETECAPWTIIEAEDRRFATAKIYSTVVEKLSEKEQSELLMRPAVLAGADIAKTVEAIVTDVRARGDDALRDYAAKFDKATLDSIRVEEKAIDEAEARLSEDIKSAMKLAVKNIESFHIAQRLSPVTVQTMPGVTCRQVTHAIDSVGLYVPGGTAPLFSTVMMLAIPARIAGCQKVILMSPPTIADEILYAAKLCGICLPVPQRFLSLPTAAQIRFLSPLIFFHKPNTVRTLK